MNKKKLVAVAVLGAALVVALAWMNRYEMRGSGEGTLWILDRWTGELTFCFRGNCKEVYR